MPLLFSSDDFSSFLLERELTIDKSQYSPTGFDIIFPGMLGYAKDLDLKLSFKPTNLNAILFYPVDIYVRLCMIDNLERFGIDWHFKQEIQSVLDETYRVLQINGYDVSSDPLTQIAKEESYFNSLGGHLKGISDALELYRASHSSNIGYKDLLKLAVEDFNICQPIHCEEAKQAEEAKKPGGPRRRLGLPMPRASLDFNEGESVGTNVHSCTGSSSPSDEEKTLFNDDGGGKRVTITVTGLQIAGAIALDNQLPFSI
ncbi:hypothetical protein LguiB_027611 [Lonicera macranthoides]